MLTMPNVKACVKCSCLCVCRDLNVEVTEPSICCILGVCVWELLDLFFSRVSEHPHSWKAKMNIEIQNECEPCSYRAGAASASVNHTDYPTTMCFPLFSGGKRACLKRVLALVVCK